METIDVPDSSITVGIKDPGQFWALGFFGERVFDHDNTDLLYHRWHITPLTTRNFSKVLPNSPKFYRHVTNWCCQRIYDVTMDSFQKDSFDLSVTPTSALSANRTPLQWCYMTTTADRVLSDCVFVFKSAVGLLIWLVDVGAALTAVYFLLIETC